MERTASGTALEATAAILLVTAICDSLGLHSASFLFLVLGVPVVAYGGLSALAHVIDLNRGRIQVALAASLLAIVLFGAAVRSPAVAATGLRRRRPSPWWPPSSSYWFRVSSPSPSVPPTVSPRRT